MPEEWVVLLEAGGKQDFIFASNKQAVNVGASHLIREVGTTWVREAIEKVAGKEHVEEYALLSISGKAVLIVPDQQTGQRIIGDISTRALKEAPGLDVCGVVCPVTQSLAEAVVQASEQRRRTRSERASLSLRYPALPYSQPCQYSGTPAVAMGYEGELSFPRSASIDTAWRAGADGRRRMAADLKNETAVLGKDKLAQGVSNAGWIAVLHADGNRIGRLFGTLRSVRGNDLYRKLYKGLSAELDELTMAAMRHAVGAARRQDRKTGAEREPEDWILPLVIGGDDVTAIMDARYALRTTETFLREFAARSAASQALRKLLSELWTAAEIEGAPPAGLSASAGIAFVKPHHPFSDAYALAEELCASAKTVCEQAGELRCVLDFHVVHDSITRNLSDLRPGVPTPRPWGGPYVVSPLDPHEPRSLELLHDAVRALRPTEDGALFGVGALRRLHTAVRHGSSHVDRERKQLLAWHDRRAEAEDYLDRHLRVESADGEFSRIVDAIHVLDMETGTAAGNTVDEAGRRG